MFGFASTAAATLVVAALIRRYRAGRSTPPTEASAPTAPAEASAPTAPAEASAPAAPTEVSAPTAPAPPIVPAAPIAQAVPIPPTAAAVPMGSRPDRPCVPPVRRMTPRRQTRRSAIVAPSRPRGRS
ncbi:MAG TPA: hypothetical protein VF755_18520 [Catenuloplanes sp.]